ncbi:MAG TPA: GxxExxY protein [Candidatus Marinimicrobia bacterium]|nr:GxxExxY protein [Candidatus Neomarinimicrobiota bacterium]
MAYLYENESYQIIGAAQEVHKELGSGFLEVVYQDALEMELNGRQVPFQRECPLDIFYKNRKLPRTYYADFVCFEKIIIETKAVKSLTEEHYAQVLHYLKATRFRLALLINFAEPSLKVKRIIL